MLYRDIFFQQTNYLSKPLHKQLEYALLREMMLPSEPGCVVDDRVRRLLTWMQSPRTRQIIMYGTLRDRYDLFESELWDKWKRLYKLDVKSKKDKPPFGDKDKGQDDESSSPSEAVGGGQGEG